MSVASQENKQMLLDLIVYHIINDNNLSYAKNSDLVNFIDEKCNYFHTQEI